MAAALRTDINRETYAPGSPLPGEVAMAARYNTSRPTVRKAIAELAGEGLLSAAHGRGTFVRPRPDRRTIAIGQGDHVDFLEEDFNPVTIGWGYTEHPDAARLRAQGTEGVTRAVITTATRDQAEALGTHAETLILYRFAHYRHRHTHRLIAITSAVPAHLIGIPIDPGTHDHDPDNPYLSRWAPLRRHPDDEPDPGTQTEADDEPGYEPDPSQPDPDPDDGNTTSPALYHLLAVRHGPVAFTTTVSARMPRGDELNDLGTEPGTPLLTITRTMTDPHGRILETTLIEAPADRFAVTSATTPGNGIILTV
ncbi:GntR family transcriptional regulator [Catenulispora yoronensis]